jgi:hypothetical protein
MEMDGKSVFFLKRKTGYHRSSTGQDESVSINPFSPQSPQQDAQTAIVSVYLDVLPSFTAHYPIASNKFFT